MIADEQAETAVLGCMLLGKTCADTGLTTEAFTGNRRTVWEAMVALEAERPRGAETNLDLVQLAERLKARGQLAKVGGPSYLMTLDQGAPFLHNLPAYVATCVERQARRDLESIGETILAKARDLMCPPAPTATSMAARLLEVRPQRRLRYAGELVYGMIDGWEARMMAARDGGHASPTLPWPHEPYGGSGPLRGKMFVVAGRSGNFKTGKVSDAIWHWGHTLGLKGGVMGLEDGCSWFLERLTARRISISYEQIGYARLDEGQQVALQNWCAEAHDTLSRNVFMEDDKSLGDGAMVTFHKDVYPTLQLWADNGAKWAVVDHGLCIDWATGSGVDRPDMAIGRGLRMCSRLAERTGMAVGFLWHLNRVQDEGAFPKRSDLAESAYLDREARRIDVLWKQPNRPGFQLSTCVKATKGEEGVTMALPLYDAPYGLLGLTKGYRVDFEAEEKERKQRAEEERASRGLKSKGRRLFGDGE